MSDSDWGSDEDGHAPEAPATPAPALVAASNHSAPKSNAPNSNAEAQAQLNLPKQVFLGVLVKCYLVEQDPKCLQPIFTGMVFLFDPPTKNWTMYSYHVQNQQQPIFLEQLNSHPGFTGKDKDKPNKLPCELQFGKGNFALYEGCGRKWRLDFNEINLAFRFLAFLTLGSFCSRPSNAQFAGYDIVKGKGDTFKAKHEAKVLFKAWVVEVNSLGADLSVAFSEALTAFAPTIDAWVLEEKQAGVSVVCEVSFDEPGEDAPLSLAAALAKAKEGGSRLCVGSATAAFAQQEEFSSLLGDLSLDQKRRCALVVYATLVGVVKSTKDKVKKKKHDKEKAAKDSKTKDPMSPTTARDAGPVVATASNNSSKNVGEPPFTSPHAPSPTDLSAVTRPPPTPHATTNTPNITTTLSPAAQMSAFRVAAEAASSHVGACSATQQTLVKKLLLAAYKHTVRDCGFPALATTTNPAVAAKAAFASEADAALRTHLAQALDAFTQRNEQPAPAGTLAAAQLAHAQLIALCRDLSKAGVIKAGADDKKEGALQDKQASLKEKQREVARLEKQIKTLDKEDKERVKARKALEKEFAALGEKQLQLVTKSFELAEHVKKAKDVAAQGEVFETATAEMQRLYKQEIERRGDLRENIRFQTDLKEAKGRSLLELPDSCAACPVCKNSFGLLTRRAHCRLCGGVFCRSCCEKEKDLPAGMGYSSKGKVCGSCASYLEKIRL
jgi:hypothetical protein